MAVVKVEGVDQNTHLSADVEFTRLEILVPLVTSALKELEKKSHVSAAIQLGQLRYDRLQHISRDMKVNTIKQCI